MSKLLLSFLVLVTLLTPLQAQTETTAPASAAAKTSAATSAEDANTSVYGSIVGRVVSEDGPLAFVPVTLWPVSSRTRGNTMRMATTDADGNFKVDGLRAAAWNIMASAQGYVAEVAEEENPQTFYRVGEQATIRLTKGGVITGRVLNPGGEPIIAIPVTVQMVRDAKGQPATGGGANGFFQTDDRGVYRVYGLAPGSYVVYAGRNTGAGGGRFSPYEGNAPVYFPSATRDTAIEVSVGSGAETGGIDIQYRGEKGFAVSGKIIAGTTENTRRLGGAMGGVSVTLIHAATGAVLNRTFVLSRNGANVYSLGGVPNGEYEVAAQRNAPGEDSAASLPRRLTVSGRDVTGIDLSLLPLASITGNLQLENTTNPATCNPKQKLIFDEQLFALQPENAAAQTAQQNRFGAGLNAARPVAPNRVGEFSFRDLANGHYRLTPKLLDEHYYLRAIVAPGAVIKTAAKTPPKVTMQDVAKNGVNLKSGEKLTGLLIKVASGAASLSGAIKAASGAALSPNLHLYLLPVERERQDEILFYYEAAANASGNLRLANLAPGKYFLVALSESPTEKTKLWVAAERAKLRRAAEALNQTVELANCQQLTNYEVRLK